MLSQDRNKEALGLIFARRGAATQAKARPINRTAAMLSTIEITPSRVAGFFGYFAVLSLLMLPAAVAFARRKTSRWFLLSAGLLLLIGGALNWWGLLPTFSWHGYEPDWPPICVGAFLVMMLLRRFSGKSAAAADGKDEIFSPSPLDHRSARLCGLALAAAAFHAPTATHVRRLSRRSHRENPECGRKPSSASVSNSEH